jgi:type II secretory pathway component GspD/PulD (secretin)
MKETTKKLITCAILLLSAGISEGAEETGSQSMDVGRDNPFGGSFGEIPQEIQAGSSAPEETFQIKPPLFVQTVTLKFLKASNLKTALDKMSSEFGSIGVDDNTNSLIICDTKENLAKIIAEARKADQTPQQIMIEVVIIDVQLKDDTEIGVDWDFLTTGNKDLSYRQSMIFPNRLSIVGATDTTRGDITAFQPVGLGSEISIISDDIRNVVRLLQEKRNVEILASPRVMVVSGQKAEIRTIEEIPYQQITQSTAGGGGASAITSTEFKEVGVTMEVKATVTDNGKILLMIKPEQSVSTGKSIGGVPVIDKRGASTTLLMDDGQMVVMGGLRRQETSHIKDQVPLLGDLPLIGFIFSNDHTVVENSELMVLLSPHVYKGEPVPKDAMDRYNQINESSFIGPVAKTKPGQSKQVEK